jgi:elongation factor Tu
MDGAILVVGAGSGPTPQTREHILLARQVGVPALVVYLDGAHLLAAPELDAMEAEIRAMDAPAGAGLPLPIVRSVPSGLESMRLLRDAMALHVPLRTPAADQPFLMAVDGAFTNARGTVATGRIETGRVRRGDRLEIADLPLLVDVDALVRLRRSVDVAEAGDDLGLLLQSAAPGGVPVGRGMVIAAPGTVTPHQRFTALVIVKEEGGRHTPFQNAYRPRFVVRTADVEGEVELEPGRARIQPGEYGLITTTLVAPVAMDEGLRFAIREGGRTVGAGVVVEILD